MAVTQHASTGPGPLKPATTKNASGMACATPRQLPPEASEATPPKRKIQLHLRCLAISAQSWAKDPYNSHTLAMNSQRKKQI